MPRHGRRVAFFLFAGVLLPGPVAGEPCATLRELAPALYQRPARGDEASAANGGEVAPVYALRGTSGWVLLDPGPHYAAGRALACALARIDAQAVVAIVNTRPRAERVLANGAFAGVPIYASGATAATMARRCPACLGQLRDLLGEPAMAGTVPRLPTVRVDAPLDLFAGGLRLRLMPLPAGGLAVLDLERRHLFSGDAAAPDAVPEPDAATPAQLLAVAEALVSVFERAGLAGWWAGGAAAGGAAELARRVAYLQTLIAAAESAVARGEPLLATPGLTPRDAAERRRDQRNAQRAWRLAEQAWWDGAGAE